MLIQVGFHPIVVYLFQPFFRFNCNHKNDEEGWCHSGQFLKIFPHSFQFQMYPFFPFFVEVKTIFIDWFSMVYDLQITGRFSSKNKEGKTLLWCSFSRHNVAKVFLESLNVLQFSFWPRACSRGLVCLSLSCCSLRH